MRMIHRGAWGLWILIAENPSCSAVDEGSVYLHTFDTLLSIGWCHGVLVVGVELLLGGSDFPGAGATDRGDLEYRHCA